MFRILALVVTLAAAMAIAYYEVKGRGAEHSRPKETIDQFQHQADKIQADLQKQADETERKANPP